jgi:protein SMG6
MLFTNIQLDDFSPTLARLLERLTIEEPEVWEWTMMVAINIGALLEYGRPQGILWRADIPGQLNRNPAATVAAAKVKLARKAHATKMEVNGDERRWSNDMGGLNTQGPSIDATASQEPPFVFKMAQELTFSMLAHVLRSVMIHVFITFDSHFSCKGSPGSGSVLPQWPRRTHNMQN